MTRKDYILIAGALRQRYQDAVRIAEGKQGFVSQPIAAAIADDIVVSVAGALSLDNPRFDREHFLAVVRGEKDLSSRPARCKHIPHNSDVAQTVCEKCGIGMDLR